MNRIGVIGILITFQMMMLSGQEKKNLYFWETGAPADIPFESSDELVEIGFTGRYKNYTTADTWYPTWAEDGNLYSPYTDGAVDDILSISDADWSKQGTENTTTGNAVILKPIPNAGTLKSIFLKNQIVQKRDHFMH